MDAQETQGLLKKLKITPNKYRGQNFLVDNRVLDSVISAANIKTGETIVEIGPGLGVLTERLLNAGAKVIAIEKEYIFSHYLRNKFEGRSLSVVSGNAVFKIPELVLPKQFKVVSNLPYGITSPVINLFLTKISSAPQEMVLMIQKEVAQRLVAEPGNSDRGVSTVLVELVCGGNKKIILDVAPGSFWPKPKVDSAILKLNYSPTVSPGEVEKVLYAAKMGFSKKRAKLKNALKGKVEDPTSLLSSVNIDLSLRAEDLAVEQWIRLADKINQTN